MRQMEERILQEGEVLPGDILKVGSFLNQNIDTVLLAAAADEIARLFAGEGVSRILTIEASGIAIATAAGMALGAPVLFAKKHRTSNVDGATYQALVHSFTHGRDYHVVVAADYLRAGDRVLLVDDFLASGNALRGLVELCGQAGAAVAGAAVAVEKCFTGAGDALRAEGLRVEALAAVESMDPRTGTIRFRHTT